MVRIKAELTATSGGVPFVIRDNLRNLEFDALDRGNVSDLINWGIMSNQGAISCNDYNGTFASIYRNNPTLSGYKVLFYLEYPDATGLGTATSKIGTFNISDTRYDQFAKKVELKLTDGFESWQEKNIDIDFSNYVGTSQTLYTLFNDINTIINNKYGISFSLGTNVQSLFQSITISLPYRKETVTIWSIINEICAMSMCRVTADVNGTPYFNISPTTSDVASKTISPHQILSVDLAETPQHSAIKGAVVSVQKTVQKKMSVIGKKKIHLMKDAVDAYDQPEGSLFEVSLSNAMVYTPNIGAQQETDYYKNAVVSTISPIEMDIEGAIARWEYASGTGTFVQFDSTMSSESRKDIKFQRPITVDQSSQNGVNVTLSFNIDKVTIYGDLLGDAPSIYQYYESIDVDLFALVKMIDGTEDVWSGYKQGETVTLSSSPWLQDANTKSDQDHALWLVNTVYNAYKDGVECLEMTCPILEKRGSANLFSRYDVVIPYISTPNGEIPYSTYSNGTAKKYLVLGYKFINNGHPTQKLYLQEI